MESKLNLNMEYVAKAQNHAKRVAEHTQAFIDRHTTVTVERTICRFMGIDGTNEVGVPMPNIVVDQLFAKQALSAGAAYYIGNAMIQLGLTPQEIAEKISGEDLDITKLPLAEEGRIREAVDKVADATIAKILKNREDRDRLISELGEKQGPYLYAMVATGNIYEDIVQAKSAVKQGADAIAVIRSTGQSLLDYVPYGVRIDGFGGTYATQENMRLMRAALDEAGREAGRYIRQCNYASGLCMPEIAALGAMERLDFMLNDAFYGILFRDINMKRTLIDQFFSRIINSFAGLVINTGEDNFLTTSDAVEEAHTVLCSQMLNYQFALRAGVPEEQIGLGDAFEIDPKLKNGFLYGLAQAQMGREIFPKCKMKYMPPTKFMTGDIFMGNVQDAVYNMLTIMTGQKIHLLGMLTEAIHTPFMADRALAIQNASYIFNTMEDLGSEVTFKEGGIIQTRANEVVKKACDLLEEIEKQTLFEILSTGAFAGIKRRHDGGKGLAGVVEKGEGYFNPFIEKMFKGGVEL